MAESGPSVSTPRAARPELPGRNRGDHQAKQGTGNLGPEPVRDDRRCQDGHADDHGVKVGLRHLLEHTIESHQQMWVGGSGDTQDARQLPDDDVDRYACQEADGDRNRQQIGQPAGLQEAHDHQDRADHQRKDCRESDVACGITERHRGDHGGEDRRDGRIGADGDEAIAADRGEGDGSRGEGDQLGFGRHAGKMSGGDLPRQHDGHQHQPCHGIRRQP